MNAEDYLGHPVDGRQGRAFEPWGRRGFKVFKVLSELVGKPWDNHALGLIHGLRPSHVRVVADGGGAQLDSQLWRVTVHVNPEGIIQRIEQEVQIGIQPIQPVFGQPVAQVHCILE